MAAPAYRTNPFADPQVRYDEKRRSDDEPAMNPSAQRMPALAAPRPGYAAPIAALSAREASPSPNPFNPGPPQQQLRQPPPAVMNRPPVAPIQVPSTPHPLPPTMTPIRPIFAKPEKESSIRFEGTPILRSGEEDTPIRRRGEKGDDFWRRFSMVAKEENKESKWLHETTTGISRWSRYVWVIGLLLLACIGLAVGLGVYSHLTTKASVQSTPKAIGGSADESGSLITTATVQHAAGASTSLHVSPTYTVARREPEPAPTPNSAVIHALHLPGTAHGHRRSRRRENRTIH